MSRPYHPHPGKIPDDASAKQRWIKKARFKLVGEVPYQSYPERAATGESPFRDPVMPWKGESLPQLMSRIQDSGGLRLQAAYSVALGMLNDEDHFHAGRRAVHSRELFEHRKSAAFLTSPTPVRGDLSKCVNQATFLYVYPSIAVNLSVLNGLRWSENLRASDIFFLWLLIAYHAPNQTPIRSLSALKRLGIKRPNDHFNRIALGRFGILDANASVLGEGGQPILLNNRLNTALLEAVFPRGGGENYGFLELYPISQMTARWQELAFRHCLAAAVRAKIYWSHGGSVPWRLSLEEAENMFSLKAGGAERLKKERLAGFSRFLQFDAGISKEGFAERRGRIAFTWRFRRAKSIRGRPVCGLDIDLGVMPAQSYERPTSQYSLARTHDRQNRQEKIVQLAGLSAKPTDEQRRLSRSLAAKKGWLRRRSGQPKLEPKRKMPTSIEVAEARLALAAQRAAGTHAPEIAQPAIPPYLATELEKEFEQMLNDLAETSQPTLDLEELWQELSEGIKENSRQTQQQ